ncbi:TRAP transporter small permease [Arenibacterium sp. LLYu02]|uniref:TRAP transporter small permease n=1 Tax=Arenibacterium sp. LLYu02 TaxID=3404132 RepID=UPI003B2179F9
MNPFSAQDPQRLAGALRSLGAGLLALTVALTFAQVVLRFGFDRPQAWVEEISRYLLVWITFIGAAAAYATDEHIRVTALTELLDRHLRRPLLLFRMTAELLAVGVMILAGTTVAWDNRAAGFYTAPSMPQVIFHLAIPVGGLLMTCGLLLWIRARRSQ